MAERVRRTRLGLGLGRKTTGPVEQRRLLRCRAGPHVLVVDLRSISLVGARRPGGEDAAAVDVREVLGVPAEGPGHRVLFRPDGGADPVALVFDDAAGLVRPSLDRVHPLPAVLRGAPGLEALKGVVTLDEEVAFLLDPHALLADPAAAAAPEEG